MILLPEPSQARKVRVTITRVWEREIASFLRQRAVESGELTNLDQQAIALAVFGTNILNPHRLSPQGELLDYWETPIRIEIVGQTNFIIRSAGENQMIGDGDDIVFESLANDFVKP